MEHTQRAPARQDGFTMIEILVAISILAVGLLALAAMQTSAIRGNGFAMRYTAGVALAQDAIENYMTLPYADLPAGQVDEPGIGNSGIYTRTSTFQANTPFARTTTITVTVNWRGSSVRLQTIRSD